MAPWTAHSASRKPQDSRRLQRRRSFWSSTLRPARLAAETGATVTRTRFHSSMPWSRCSATSLSLTARRSTFAVTPAGAPWPCSCRTTSPVSSALPPPSRLASPIWSSGITTAWAGLWRCSGTTTTTCSRATVGSSSTCRRSNSCCALMALTGQSPPWLHHSTSPVMVCSTRRSWHGKLKDTAHQYWLFPGRRRSQHTPGQIQQTYPGALTLPGSSGSSL
mmetsp:Transcript_66812/g.150885  ORF Transcript_66812/g.150885 Transcript_66812/m.150885 type:complete len:220 (+) Transcript_66812:496-1155(+)